MAEIQETARRAEIRRLADDVRQFDPQPSEFCRQWEELRSFSADFLADVQNGEACLGGSDEVRIDSLLNDAPRELSQVLTEFQQDVLPFGFNPSSGGFFGYVPGGGLPSAAFGDYLAALTNRYAGVFQASPGAAEVENLCIRWLCEMIGYSSDAWGALLSGGTLATLTCVVAARDLRPRHDWERSVIYLSPEIHKAIDKSLKVAGLAHVPVRRLAVNDRFQVEVDDFIEKIEQDKRQGLSPWMLFCSAGTVNTGAIDPLSPLADVCEKESLWMHVDGAYGGCFVLTDSVRCSEWLADLARADSVVLDPHKGLFLPYGCGAALVKKGSDLKSAFAMSADYLADVEDHEHSSPADYSPELTRHFRGLRLWFSLRLHGLQRFRNALTEKLLLAQEVHDNLSGIPGIQIGPQPQLSIATYRLEGGDTATQEHLQRLLATKRVHLSTTRLHGDLFIRVCVLSFRTHQERVDELIELIKDDLSSFSLPS